MIKELTQYIEDNSYSSLVIGTNLFGGHRPPDAPDECVVVLETGGLPYPYSGTLRGEASFEILARDKTYFECRDLIWSVFEIFRVKGEITLPVVISGDDWLIESIVAINRPQSLGQDDKGLFEMSVNYIAYCKKI